MNEQRHIIKRQTIELKVKGSTPSQQFQAEISRIYRQRIIPLINEYCTALSTPDHIHRLDFLEIDLGHIDFQHLETDFVAKIQATLYQALADQIHQQEQAIKHQELNLKTHSQLELLTFFVQTGNLPWWAETTQPQLLEDCLQHLIQTAPELLQRLMKKWCQEKHSLHRIVFHYEDELLSKLANLLAPSLNHSLTTDPQILSLLLQKSSVATNKSVIQLKQHIWYIVLSILSLAENQLSKPKLFYQAVLTRIAIKLKITYKSLLTAIYQVLPETKISISNEFKNILENLHQKQIDNTETQFSSKTRQNQHLPNKFDELPLRQIIDPKINEELLELTNEIYETWNQENRNIITKDSIQTDLSLSEALTTLPQYAKAMDWSIQEITELNQIIQLIYRNNFNQSDQSTQNETSSITLWLTTKIFLDRLWIQLENLIVSLSIPLQNKLHQTFQIITNQFTRNKKLPIAIWSDLLRLLRPFLASQNQHLPNKFNELPLQQTIDPKINEELLELTNKVYETWDQEDTNNTIIKNDIPLDLSFSETDELYISNAGLVILWPFLEHFFNHLNLLTEDQQFKNFVAIQRAVTLLQYLTNKNNNFPEYQLALNKVLCGIAVTDIYHLDSPFLESEMNECTTLLKTIIAQAPILHNMSESGLRGTFLLRSGILTIRDGAWLLQVERETYDIVLDRFPWSWSWIKLPWMEVPLRVEW